MTAIARSENDLDKLKVDMDAVRVHEDQVLSIQRLDLTNSEEVRVISISESKKERFLTSIYLTRCPDLSTGLKNA